VTVDTQRQSPGSTTSQSGKGWNSGPGTDFLMNADAVDAAQITAIQTADGSWQKVSECQQVLYTVGNAHSPINFDRGFPALRYRNEAGNIVRTPLKHILSVATAR
jgi:hypothetical protein